MTLLVNGRMYGTSEAQTCVCIGHAKPKDFRYTHRVVGDSMSPEYLDGDIVLMDYALQPRGGDVVAALVDGAESTLKTYSRQGDKITLTPIETKRQPRHNPGCPGQNRPPQRPAQAIKIRS